MAFFPFSRRRGSRPGSKPALQTSAKSAGKPLDEDRLRLEREIAELNRKTEEVERMAAQKMREMAELPQKIAARERRQEEMIRIRAIATVTDEGFGRLRDKRHAPLRRSGPKRMTRKDQSAARMQLLMLAAVLAVLLILLWRSLP